MVAMRSLVLATLGLLALVYPVNAYNRGMGTAYSGAYEKDDTGKNSCGLGKLDDQWERYYAAIPSHKFQRSMCGTCIRVRGTESDAPGNWVKVMIVDECAGSGCDGDGDVDFSSPALEAITGYSWDRKGIEWEETSCDGSASTNDDSDNDDEASTNNDSDNGDESTNNDDDSNDDDSNDDDNNDDDDDNNDEDDNRRRRHRMLLRA